MPATARKPSTAAASPKKRPAKPRKPEVPRRPVARVSEVDGAIAVLANDPEFQKEVADQIAVGAGAQVLGRIFSDILSKFAASNEGRALPAVAPEGMRAAAELFAEVLKHNDEPSDDEIDAMVRSWSA
jgi:hypothetical protein